jgi:hypothetical protein
MEVVAEMLSVSCDLLIISSSSWLTSERQFPYPLETCTLVGLKKPHSTLNREIDVIKTPERTFSIKFVAGYQSKARTLEKVHHLRSVLEQRVLP